MNKLRFIHLIPEDRVGGVEVAAKSFPFFENDIFKYSVKYIYDYPELRSDIFFSLFRYLKIICLARKISKGDVNVIIVSLWRSCLCGLLIKLFNPKIKLITFLHSCNDVHFVDYLLTRISVLFSFRIFSDSAATILQRLPWLSSTRVDIVSFVINRYSNSLSKNATPSFIFWGRLSKEKGLDIAIDFFYTIYRNYEYASFLIIGPDCGVLSSLKTQVKSLKLESSVIFSGPLSSSEIVKRASMASFYLQASHYEGMGMSVVEAMQLGLVPVVTPVGQIASYCKDGYNSVFLNNKNSLKDVLFAIENVDIYHALSQNSVTTWKNHQIYSEAMIAACEKIAKLLEKTG
ncbi:glycosyltransferase family 4 protein [Polynucleobacter alcilacus]|uniref:glycosyltransferase family 4 protein n=1 Tax=Polynucleobacter alcilacus TaxID=1819739 RepID=UPI001C0AC58F|nr:glycosyltransferase family 4 protein [Polynucleobacter alcilacus]MBU3568196.1 glycosyltransferase family 4 protein [Polynucleobacter alcilacus]